MNEQAPSPYSPPIPNPALMIVGNTKTAAALVASSRDPPMRQWKSLSVASTAASETASAPGDDPMASSVERKASDSALRRLIIRLTCLEDCAEM
jgi:hypothetical protein